MFELFVSSLLGILAVIVGLIALKPAEARQNLHHWWEVIVRPLETIVKRGHSRGVASTNPPSSFHKQPRDRPPPVEPRTRDAIHGNQRGPIAVEGRCPKCGNFLPAPTLLGPQQCDMCGMISLVKEAYVSQLAEDEKGNHLGDGDPMQTVRSKASLETRSAVPETGEECPRCRHFTMGSGKYENQCENCGYITDQI